MRKQRIWFWISIGVWLGLVLAISLYAAPIRVIAIGFRDSGIVWNEKTDAVVVIDQNAPTGGLIVSMSVGTDRVVSVPSQLRIMEGRNTGFFTVTPYGQLAVGSQTTIRAKYGTSFVEGIVEVLP